MTSVIPLVYLGVIVTLFGAAFGETEVVQAQRGAIELDARSTEPPLGAETAVSRATVRVPGLDFWFSGRESVQVKQPNAAPKRLRPVGWQAHDAGFTIELEDGYAVDFVKEPGEQETIQIAVIVPEDAPSSETIYLPLRTADSSRVQPGDHAELLAIQGETERYELTLPSRGIYDSVNRQVAFPVGEATPTLRFVSAPDAAEGTFEEWFAADDLEMDGEEFHSLLKEYRDQAYHGWESDRFNAQDGTWDSPDGVSQFEERILVAFLAEAWERGEYTRVHYEMRTAADRHSDRLGHRSAVYLGDLNEQAENMVEALEQESRRIEDALRAGETAVLAEPRVIERARTKMPEAYEEIIAFVDGLDPETDELEAFIGPLETYIRPRKHSAVDHDDLPGEALEDLLTGRLIDSLRNTEDGFFVETSDGKVDLELSLRYGMVLAEADLEDERKTHMGRRLVQSVIDVADDTGVLPARLELDGSSIVGVEGTVGPEQLYPILYDPEFYPRAVSLEEALDRGSFVLAAVNLSADQFDETELELSIDNEPGRTHYLLIHGVPALSSMELFGMTWRNDPRFEEYARGRNYIDDLDTLAIKYSDDSSGGRIVLRY